MLIVPVLLSTESGIRKASISQSFPSLSEMSHILVQDESQSMNRKDSLLDHDN